LKETDRLHAEHEKRYMTAEMESREARTQVLKRVEEEASAGRKLLIEALMRFT